MTDLECLHAVAKAMETPPFHGPTLPDERLKNALALVESGAVSVSAQGYLVKGRTRSYVVDDACTCEDATKRKNPWCYHRVATELYQRWHTTIEEHRMADQESHSAPLEPSQDPLTAEPALEPEQDAFHLPLPLGRMLRPLHAILADLRKPLPDDCVPSFKGPGNTEIDFLSWRQITHLLHVYAPGWYPEVARVDELESLTIVVRLNILSAEGRTGYEGIGREDRKSTEIKFGDRTRTAYAKALKHAAQLLGMDWLQEDAEKSQTLTAMDKYLLNEQLERIKALGDACERAGLDKKAYNAALMRQAGVTSGRHIPLAMLQEALATVEAYAAARKE